MKFPLVFCYVSLIIRQSPQHLMRSPGPSKSQVHVRSFLSHTYVAVYYVKRNVSAVISLHFCQVSKISKLKCVCHTAGMGGRGMKTATQFANLKQLRKDRENRRRRKTFQVSQLPIRGDGCGSESWKSGATVATCSVAKQITHQSCHRAKRWTLHLLASEAADGTSSPDFLLAFTAGAAGKPATAHPESTRGQSIDWAAFI